MNVSKVKHLREMQVVNCTPHPISLLAADSYIYEQVKPRVLITFPISEHIARVTYNTELVERLIIDNVVIDVTSTKYSKVMGLPEPKKGVIYLVSKLVAEVLHGERDDLYILSGFTRDKGGKIMGGRSLAKLIPILK